MALGPDIDFIGQTYINFQYINLDNIGEIENIIINVKGNPKLQWIEDTSLKIGEWRAKFRSAYIRWALAINGLHVAKEIF